MRCFQAKAETKGRLKRGKGTPPSGLKVGKSGPTVDNRHTFAIHSPFETGLPQYVDEIIWRVLHTTVVFSIQSSVAVFGPKQ
jgi:hypothetical protein